MATDVLGTMITPVVLLSGTGLFVLTTNTRLARVVDRIRQLDAALERLGTEPPSDRRRFLADRYSEQLDILERRGLALKRALLGLHAAFCCFIASSLLLAALVPLGGVRLPAVVLASTGMVALLYSAVLVTLELRSSFHAVRIDLDVGRSAHARIRADDP